MSTWSRQFFIAGVVALLGIVAAHAFWSKTFAVFKIHQTITSTALGTLQYTFDTTTPMYHFSGNAIHVINDSHSKADSSPYDERDHFDNESFTGSFKRLASRRAQLMVDLATSNPDMAGTDWPLLGYMLHQIQDFYSHSTWAEAHQITGNGTPTIANFGAATEPAALAANTGSLPAFLQMLPVSSAVCNSTPPAVGSNLESVPSPLTTGYFAPGILSSGTFYQPSPPPGRCAHGVLAYAASTGCLPQALSGTGALPDGIAHDEPCFAFEDDIKIYADAYAMAQLETQTFIQAIANDLLAQGNRQGFCYLFDLDQTKAPCLSDCAIQASQVILPQYASAISSGGTLTVTIGDSAPITYNDAGGYYNKLNIFALEGLDIIDIAVAPTPHATGSFQALGAVRNAKYPNTALLLGGNNLIGNTLILGEVDYAISNPSSVTINTFNTICSDPVSQIELDSYTGSINVGLAIANPISGLGVYANGTITGTVSGNALICKAGTAATPASAANPDSPLLSCR